MVRPSVSVVTEMALRHKGHPITKTLSLNPTRVEIHKQSNLCRVEREYGKFGGYKKDILTENLSERDVGLLICGICEGIIREACVSGSGEQICSCCEIQESMPKPRGLPRIHPRHTPNLAVRKMVSSLKCSCPLTERGCKWSGTLKGCEDHLDTCGYVRDQCKLKCGVVLQRNELRVHEEKKCPLCIVKCVHCKGNLKLGDMPIHLEVCPKMMMLCTPKCGKFISREDMAHHLKKECGAVQEMCKLDCGMKLARNYLKIHMNNCPHRKMECEHCIKDFKFCDIPKHLKDCPKAKLSCELKCGVTVCREDMVQHLEHDCGLVIMTCALGCGEKFLRDTLKAHMKDTCVQREISCEHCFKNFKFCHMSTHIAMCPRMIVSCEQDCGITMTRDEQTTHMHTTCVKREVQCDHCSKYSEFCDMSQHLNMCPKMKLPCELCGIVMCREDTPLHLEEYCPENEIPCPFAKYKCDVRMKRKSMSIHLEKKRTAHLELKLNGLEKFVTEQSVVTTPLNWQEEMTKQLITLNNLSEQINTLCSINNTTKLEWHIADITDFVLNVHRVKQEQVNGFVLNTVFHRQSIWVSFGNNNGSYQTTAIAKFIISLYSTIKMKIIKQYKYDISQFPIGNVEQKIAHIPTSDIQEFSHIGATKDIILEMYVTMI